MPRPPSPLLLRVAAVLAAASAVWLALAAAGAQTSQAPPSADAAVEPFRLDIALEGDLEVVHAGVTVGVIAELTGVVRPRGEARIQSLELIAVECAGTGDVCDDRDVQPSGAARVSRAGDATHFFDTATWLVLPPPYSWAHNGGRRTVAGDGNLLVRCYDRDAASGAPAVAAGDAAIISCRFMVRDVRTGALSLPRIVVPAGPPERSLEVTAEMEFEDERWGAMEIVVARPGGTTQTYYAGGRRTYFALTEFQVFDVDPAAEVRLDWDGFANEAVVPQRGSATAVLRLTDGLGAASSVARHLRSIIFNTTVGSISASSDLALPAGSCSAGASCVITGTGPADAGIGVLEAAYRARRAAAFAPGAAEAPRLSYIEADRAAGPSSELRVRVSCTAPGSFGDLSASVVTSSGNAFDPDDLGSLRLICGGEAVRLALSPSARDRSHSIFQRPTEDDDLDMLRVAIRGEDVSGRNSELPGETAAELRDADGRLVRGIASSIECDDPPMRTQCDAVLRVTEPAGVPTGDYELLVHTPGLRSLHVPFHVSGPPASITVTDDLDGSELLIGQTTQVTIEVLDTDGSPVADGTPVRISRIATAGSPEGALQIVRADRTTTGGRATAAYVALAQGQNLLSVSAGGAASLHVIRSSALVTGRGCTIEDLRPAPQPGEYATWVGSGGYCFAADMIGEIEGAAVLWLVTRNNWLGYAEIAPGTAVPGARNFPLYPGDLIWIGS